MSPRSTGSVGTDRSFARPYVSKIGILPSSLPTYHRDYMDAKRSGRNIQSTLSQAHVDADSPAPQTEAEKVENARRLNPHSRSQLKLDEASKRPAGMTPVPQKKARPTKWQFGIRSRNQPLEAIGCIYRALQKLGAEWVIDEGYDENSHGKREVEGRCVAHSCLKIQLMRSSTNNNSFASERQRSGASLHHEASMTAADSENRSSKPSFVSYDPDGPYNLPADPWVLRVRWKKGGMYPPGTKPPGSTHSSSIDLRRQSIVSLGSTGGSLASQDASPQKGGADTEPDDSVVMHLDIQLYEMEANVYLVDFKCAGYERPDGMFVEEKVSTSPFPFLDLASKLIIQLAEAD